MRVLLLMALIVLSACQEDDAEIPGPAALTEETLSHFCRMQVIDHGGPKAQIHLEGYSYPIFFAQVRDGLAFLKGPEKFAPVVAIYVSDMGTAPSWENPGADNWIDARDAFFVVGARVTGGMGAPEVTPFLTRDAASAFAATKGGTIMTLEQIPDEAVLSPVEISLPGKDAS
ncbi:nitrous oxide reductase accessory protein NosL [Minwuia sp.]|uniref:nitrous oxide reductase accessory protein NosL n=1 Tax=Minwuia sp. TaxID=2493630 RepID=UPI003A94DB99